MDKLKQLQVTKELSELSSAEIKDLQVSLSALGYDCRPVTGKYSKKLLNEWIKFKTDNNLSSPEKIGAGSVKLLAQKIDRLNYKPRISNPSSNQTQTRATVTSTSTKKWTISSDGMRQLANREGKRNSKYKDSVGLWTIGIGHLIKPGEVFPDVMTDEQVYDLFRKDLQVYEAAVNRFVLVTLKQNQYDALVSFVFNIGINGFAKSTVLKRLNKQDYSGAAEAMLLWNKPPEIMGRRQSEVKQFSA
jgi:GH24 family phage-related lysozyme (muramidase)